MYGLENKNVLITGAAQGIGRHTALIFSDIGSNIIAVDIKEEGLRETKELIKAKGCKCIDLVCDASKNIQVQQCVENAVAEMGQIDVLVNCAGITNSSILREIEEPEWDFVMGVNAKSVQFFIKAVVNHMISKGIKGKIVNVSSQASKIGEYGNGIYCCTKAVVNMLTQVYALELAPFGINVNAVCPGYINTEIMQKVFSERGPIEGMTPKQYEEFLLKRVPMRRMAEPAEIGQFIAFLAGNSSDYIDGVCLTIAGGSTLI